MAKASFIATSNPRIFWSSKDDQLYVSSLALAKSFEDDAVGMTRVGTFLGTPRYMSPEQVEGNPADQRSDIYAYGLILYEAGDGQCSFHRRNHIEGDVSAASGNTEEPKADGPFASRVVR